MTRAKAKKRKRRRPIKKVKLDPLWVVMERTINRHGTTHQPIKVKVDGQVAEFFLVSIEHMNGEVIRFEMVKHRPVVTGYKGTQVSIDGTCTLELTTK